MNTGRDLPGNEVHHSSATRVVDNLIIFIESLSMNTIYSLKCFVTQSYT